MQTRRSPETHPGGRFGSWRRLVRALSAEMGEGRKSQPPATQLCPHPCHYFIASYTSLFLLCTRRIFVLKKSAHT
ncbi:hypothetical protein EDB87DRAFT_1831599 [Lactarius vividus]|nr:hypothetical protein EDB87DRAFT_1831599 [Lactarius vividus]